MDPVVAKMVELLTTVHAKMREEIVGLDAAELNWAPGPDMSSITTLVIHPLGSELEALRVVRGLASDRDRPSEFVQRVISTDDLLRRIEEADAALQEHGAALNAEDLSAARERPRRGVNSGLHWLLMNYGHSCEHLAHLQMTRQLYRRSHG